MNQNLVDEYVTRKRVIKHMEDEVKQMKEELKPIEKEVLAGFEADGVASIKTSDGQTIFLHQQLWAARDPAISEEAFLISLRESGMEDLIQERVNTQTLSAVMREQAGDYLNLDEVTTPYGVKLTERVSVRVRGL